MMFRSWLLGVIMGCLLAGASLIVRAQSSEPEAMLRVQASMAKSGDISVGATSSLYLDVLTSTWFTDAPTLPVLNLPDALVNQPSGEASKLRRDIDGVSFNGLRYTYLISPTVAGAVDIPPLIVSASVGQSKAPLQAQSSALRVQAVGTAGKPGQTLTASAVQATQTFSASAQPLAVGDRIRREITIKAEGAQAMLIPPLQFAEIEGLKAYVAQPVLSTVSDARGGFEGGQRVERVDYVVQRAGSYTLPAMDVAWWNINAKTQEHAPLPAYSVQAQAGAGAQGPFSVADVIYELSHKARFYIHGSGLALLALLVGAALVLWLAWPWLRRGQRWLGSKLAAAQARWIDSEPYAWRALRHAISHPDGRLDALYRWLRRSRGVSTFGQALRPLPQSLRKPADIMFRDCYGPDPKPAEGLKALESVLPRWRQVFRAQAKPSTPHGLHPLNPGSQTWVDPHRSNDGEGR